MNSRDWNVKLKLLRLTKRRLKLSIKSRVINSNGRCCFTTRLSGTANDTTYLSISMSVERSDIRTNPRCYSITCKSTIWRRARSRSSSKLYVAFQTLAQRETHSLQQPCVTSACTNTTPTGERFIPMVDTQVPEWSPIATSEPPIPDTSSLAELLGGSPLHEL